MKILDIVHGYQPYIPSVATPAWVKQNLKKIFLPTSVAIKNHQIKRSVQIQGWTIDSWLNSTKDIKNLANTTIENLKTSHKNKHVEFGFSGYSHALLPLLNDDLIKTQMILDYEIIDENLAKPTWFWPPEGAISQNVLRVLFELYPETVVIIPDRALKKQSKSDFIKIKHKNGEYQKALVCNTLLKDIVMNSQYYNEKPNYMPDNFDWEIIRKLHEQSEHFEYIFKMLADDIHIIARDWENKGSKKGLRKMNNGGADLKALLETNHKYLTPSDIPWNSANTINIDDIQNSTWEIDVPNDNPYLYWAPNEYGKEWQLLSNKQKTIAKEYKYFLGYFNESYSAWINKKGGIHNALSDTKTKEEIKELMPALMSCIPWHHLVKPEWYADPGFSEFAWEKIVRPRKEQLDRLLNN